MARITLNDVTIDPLRQSHALASASLVSEDASTSNYLLVQTTHIPSAQEKEQLQELGVVIHEYVPENTYLCGYRPADLDAVRALPFVAWSDVYLQGFKIAPSLRSGGLQSDLTALAEPMAGVAPGQHTVDVVLHGDVDPEADGVREQIANAAGVSPDDVQFTRNKVRLTLGGDHLGALAGVDAVRQIEEAPQWVKYNSVARPIMNASVQLNGTAFLGQGQVVAVADTGFDKGLTNDVHSAFTGRVAKLYALGRADECDDPDGHGTHVAGSVLGDGHSATMGGAIQGTAPGATLVVQSLLDPSGHLGGIPDDLRDLFEPPYQNDGARVHTNSWGPQQPGLPYGSSGFEVDDMVWQNPDLVICFAAGNSGHDRDGDGVIDTASISAQAGAKNCISVGASESRRPDIAKTYGQLAFVNFPANPIRDDPMADNPAGMAAFSSRGPSREGRIKPDVVAPGTSILSTRSRALVTPDTRFGVSTDPAFYFESGTSMATPLVAGCVAVLRETLVAHGNPTPSAALVKALLINGAVQLTGQYAPSEAGTSPNNSSGFGLVNLAGSVLDHGDTNAGFTEDGPLEQGEENILRVQVPATGSFRTLKVTLVWTDPPGAALQNDLDLIVRAVSGQERHGNMGTSTGFDRANNVEQVHWENVPPGDVDIIVRAHRITLFPQPYACVWRIS
ncbi:S8 family serine peptidase [Streptomyces sp. NRRL B-3648]|uniref:S8 family serine peptidase n=1 Tax=Streptomyces sp. NRRL B-3648 TaxID=1519493 RepID=UPI0006ADF49D|nr:S8 family serine peptidase [Streptomyces sp. NRRL B-3648]KOX11585.1 KP-43 peptidase [Streptomyces sp. NRRL B-3648]